MTFVGQQRAKASIDQKADEGRNRWTREALRGSSIGRQQTQRCQICWRHQPMLHLERLLLGHQATRAAPFA
jgi:hypothetical protein